jgi:hypothetical protein
MTGQNHVYITIDWQEQHIMGNTNRRRIWDKKRRVCLADECADVLPCSNPNCIGGGFEIGSKIKNLLVSGKENEKNSIICRNAINPDPTKGCSHTIIYSIACVRPYQREHSLSV